MKWSYAAVGMFILGFFGITIILLFQTVTTNSENDYYLLKEVTEAAMIDAIDYSYYRDTGDLRIVKEKFVENFIRRYSESTVFTSGTYLIDFYEIIETPPKVSVVITTNLGTLQAASNANEYSVQNKLDAILEYTGANTYVSGNPYVSKEYTEEYYAMPTVSGGTFNIQYSIKTPGQLVAPNIKNIKIKSVQKVSETIDQGKLGVALLKNEISYNNVTTDYNQLISSYDTSVSGVSITPYNCNPRGGNGSYRCDDTNLYYVTFNGSADKSKAIFKYKITWSYDEYEFS